MQTNNWKLNVAPIPGMIDVAVTVYRRAPYEKKYEVLRLNEKGEATIVQTEPGESTTPIFQVPANEFHAIMCAFTEYAREQGFKDAGDSFAQGKLSAVEQHLEDMRHIVFKKNPLEIINVQERHD